jgi:hypothetical protein
MTRHDTMPTAAGDDVLLSAKQIAPMLGYEDTQYKAVYARLERAGLQPWRDPDNPSSRIKRWWRSDIAGYMRRGSAPAPRSAQPEAKPTRFRKPAA